jgi:Kef-type K+ transport system membrane component KefB
MELVVLNIGLEIGVISPGLFTILVVMALVTTFMAGPLLDVIYPRRIREEQDRTAMASEIAA